MPNNKPLAKPHGLEIADMVSALRTDVSEGLSSEEAAKRLHEFGPNELASEKPVSAWRKFMNQFNNSLVLLLVSAAFISAVIWFFEDSSGLPYEAIAIVLIVLLNATMAYIQNSRAEIALKALDQLLAPQANAIRDKTRQRIASSNLVPGDIILLEEGDVIPADARLVEVSSLEVSEAPLTGESSSVSKSLAVVDDAAGLGDRSNMVFSGTSVARGHGKAIVTSTGMATEMGSIATLLQKSPKERTPLSLELDRIGRVLGVVVVAIATVMASVLLLWGEARGTSSVFEVLIFAIALAVAAVPEGLPAIVTAVLALGVQRMARRHAIVRNLDAVETLGCATVIASDKTGTLTRNEMMVSVAITASGRVDFGGNGYAPEGKVQLNPTNTAGPSIKPELDRILIAAERANNAVLECRDGRWQVLGDPTEGSLIVAALKAGLDRKELDILLPRIGEIPFSSERKLMSTINENSKQPGKVHIYTKGAPDVLLERCSHEFINDAVVLLTPQRREEIMANNDALTNTALRTLGLAFKEQAEIPKNVSDQERIEHDLVFIGLLGMLDPPREEARDAIAKTREAGIRTLMITGDHPRTARVIAEKLGIDNSSDVITGAEIARLTDQELRRRVQEASVYARVEPVHKLRIVSALQHNGDVVAMTGDGVNDAPALKAANIGVAMGITGTDVSKGAADIVLADDNFSSIVAAVDEGRTIFENIRKFLRYLLSSNIGEVMTMILGILLAGWLGLTDPNHGLILPLLATQILWINLVTDGLPALALGVDKQSRKLMQYPPRLLSEGVITRRMWATIFINGIIMATGTLLVLDYSLPGGFFDGQGTVDYARTMAFTTLTLFQLFNVFNARSDSESAFVEMFNNWQLWAAVSISMLLHIAVIYTPFLQAAFSTIPLGINDWIICIITASVVLVLNELKKLSFN